MKKIIACISLLVLSASSIASSVVPLVRPFRPQTWNLTSTATPTVMYYGNDVGYTECSAYGFDVTSTYILGYCSFYHKNVGNYVAETHSVVWDLKGIPVLGPQCAHTDPSSPITGSWRNNNQCITRTSVVTSGTVIEVTPLNTPSGKTYMYFNTYDLSGKYALVFDYPYDVLYVL